MVNTTGLSLVRDGNNLVIEIAIDKTHGQLHEIFSSNNDNTSKPFTNALYEINNAQKNPIILDGLEMKNIIFDLTKVQHIPSSDLLPFLKANRFLAENNLENKVILLNPQEKVNRVLKTTQLESIFDIREGSVEDILSTLQSESK